MQHLYKILATLSLVSLAFIGVTFSVAGATGQADTVPPVTETSVTSGKITAAEVLAQVGLVQDELEQIRFEMGRPREVRPAMDVSEAATREVFFQALTLFHKADRLSFELTRTHGEAPAQLPAHRIQGADVWAVIDAALEQVLVVKKHLGITGETRERIRPESVDYTNVYRAIIQANRQLNQLLERQFAPSDVYQQVSLAMNYAARLLAAFPGEVRIPEAPLFKPGKRPQHVYHRLVVCYKLLQEIAGHSGVSMLKFNPDTRELEGTSPSDVYDLASLLVSELAYFHAQLRDAGPPAKTYYPGRKFPSHVFQRAGILKNQLLALNLQVARNANWLID